MTAVISSTSTLRRPAGIVAVIRKRPTLWSAVAVISAWVVVWAFTKGHDTKVLAGSTLTHVQTWLGDRANDLVIAKTSNPFIQVTHWISDAFDWVILHLQFLISQPAYPRTVPEIGYLGVVVIAAWVVYAIAGLAMTALTVVSLAAFGILGFWQESMDLLIVTAVAVGLSIIIGIPFAILMARSKVARSIITPILDVMQTLPTFTYLLPIMLLFGIGAAAATICTLIYALPPVMRIASHGIREVSATTLEATTSLGQTSWQRLTKVELPMAKRTIIVGINQTTMAALSMATIAAFINGPGLGQPVVRALIALNVGQAFVPGLCIVIMAIMLDRVTTAASMYSENRTRRADQQADRRRQTILLAGVAVVAVGVYLSRNYSWASEFPSSGHIGDHIANRVQIIQEWITTHWGETTARIAADFTNWFLNPLQNLIANSPWWVTAPAIALLGLALGGWRALIAAAICLGGIFYLGLWNESMITLTSTLVATVFVMILAVIIGVWMGRSKRVDQAIRPVLDAGQTLPAFVYLIPVLALFGPNRFTAIVAGVLYAAPAAIKITADGIRGVSTTTMEAAEAAGSSRFQMITKVQLPMARSSLALATNQGLLYVLSMVVIGGLVGAGALGYDVVSGFAQFSLRGKGLAAGFCIVLLGVMLDRITRYAAHIRESQGA
jgi:glycine betaine/proline transport system permease protein